MSRLVRARALIGLIAAAWTSLYVISKISYALQGRLGVTGGPFVAPDTYSRYEPGGVATAQWSQAGIGALIVLLALLTLLPVTRPIPRWMLTVALSGVALLYAIGTTLFLGRALATDSGGAVFGLYLLLGCGIHVALLVSHHRRAEPPTPSRARQDPPPVSPPAVSPSQPGRGSPR